MRERMLRNKHSFIFFLLAFWILNVVDARNRNSDYITYRALNPDSAAVSTDTNIAVNSSITTDPSTSWVSNSGHFVFGFYEEKKGFSVGIRLFASASKTVVVWTARPDLERFTKEASLIFTGQGLFIIPDKDGKVFPLFQFSSPALYASMLDTGNLAVFGNFTILSENSTANVTVFPSGNSTSQSGSSTTVFPTGNSTSTSGNSTSPSGNSTLSSKEVRYQKSGNSTRLSNFVSYLAVGNPYSRSCTELYRCSSAGGQQDSDSKGIIWRSFDFPTDTILGGQILPCGYNLTSAADETDHSIGNYTLRLPCHGPNLISFRLNSADKFWDTGFSSGDYKNLNLDENGRLYLNSYADYAKDVSAYKPSSTNSDTLYRATLDHDGFFRLYALDLQTNSTITVNEIPYYSDKCQYSEVCGVNSYCFLANSNAQCKCMPGFQYINPNSQFAGCHRTKTLPSCRAAAYPNNISMETVENIVGMDELAYDVVSTTSKEDCSNACLIDCNCDAASFVGQQCLKLKIPLTSGRQYNNYQTIAFIKLAAEGTKLSAGEGRRKRVIRFAAIFKSAGSAISIWIVAIGAFVGAYWFLFGRFRREWRKWELALTEEIAPRYFSYKEIFQGSNEFKNQLGKGGHGTVFRAELMIGANVIVAVAVKKLHGAETEGEKEFQAEMRLIGRAYHVNLVRLIGFCHDGPSRIIVYELMSRGSLADHIFERKSRRPSWERRVAILLHAARGIHYLHCQCESKIIHRDIKPENILIAEDWTTKIADFGIAKLLNKNQTRAATRTLAAGTEGYVAPECEVTASYETEEVEVTEKADVYSYGIVVLETICGIRNRDVKPSLCELVRKRYEENELWKLVEGQQVEDSDDQLQKLVKIGLLCVQENPDARPEMEHVVFMLEGYTDVQTLLPEKF